MPTLGEVMVRIGADMQDFQQSMEQVEYQLRDVSQQMNQTGKSVSTNMKQMQRSITESSKRGAKDMEYLRDKFIASNDRMLQKTTQSQRVINNLARMDTRSLDQQFLRLGDHLERVARQGAVTNVAINELGRNASLKDLQEQVKLINQGITRMQALQTGVGIGFLVMNIGLVQMSNTVDGRLIPAAQEFKQTWLNALTPFVKAWTTGVEALIKVGTAIGKVMEKFAEVSPLLSQMAWGFLYLTTAFVLLLAPLAIGISSTGSFAAAFGVLWGTIGPFVTGLLAVIGTAMQWAAATVVVIAAIYQLWKYSEGFRNAITGIWNGIVQAAVTAFQPLAAQWQKLKQAFSSMIGAMTGRGSTVGSFFQILGNVIGKVINTVALVLLPIFQIAFQIASSVISGVINVLIFAFQQIATWWSQNSSGITSAVGVVWNYIVQAFTTVGAFLSSLIPPLKTMIASAFEFIKTVISVVMPIIVAIVVPAFQLIWSVIQFIMPAILFLFQSVWGAIKGVVTSAIAIITNVFQLFTNLLQGNFSAAWVNFKQIIFNVITFLWNYISLAFFGSILKGFAGFGQAILAYGRTAWTGLLNIIRGALTQTRAFFVSIWTGIRNFLGSIWTGISTHVLSVFQGIGNFIRSVFTSIRNVAVSAWNGVKNAMMTPIQTAKNAIMGILNGIRNAFASLRITIPKPRLPKVNIGIGHKSVGGVNIPYPTFNISWKKKGGIFDQAAIVGLAEAGTEAVLPLQNKRRMQPFAAAVAENMDSIKHPIDSSDGDIQIQIAQMVVREEADVRRIAEELYRLQKIKERTGGISFGYSV